MNRRTLLTGFLASVGIAGCDKFVSILSKIGGISEMVRSAIKMFRGSLPVLELDADTEKDIHEALAYAETALETLERVANTTTATHRGDVEKAKENLLKAYEELYKLAERVGILGAHAEVQAGPGAGDRPVTPQELAAEMAP